MNFKHYFAALAWAGIVMVAGCDRQPQKPVATKDADQPRVVCLAPEITKMIVDLKMDHLLVGIAENDNAAPKRDGLVVLGNTASIDSLNEEALVNLKPTLVIAQTSATMQNKRLEELCQIKRIKYQSYRSPKNVLEVCDIISNRDSAEKKTIDTGVGAFLGVSEEAFALKLKMLKQLAQLRDVTQPQPIVRALLVIGTGQTLMICEQNTVHEDLLRGYIRGENAVRVTTATGMSLDAEKINRAMPEVVIFLLPNDPPLKSIEEDDRLALFRGLNVPAMKRQNGFVLINDPLVMLRSTNLPQLAAAMAKALHPQIAAEIDRAMTVTTTAPTSGPADKIHGTPIPARQPASAPATQPAK